VLAPYERHYLAAQRAKAAAENKLIKAAATTAAKAAAMH